jgi:hypothetical protein
MCVEAHGPGVFAATFLAVLVTDGFLTRLDAKEDRMKATLDTNASQAELMRELQKVAAGSGGVILVVTPDLSVTADSEGSGCNQIKFTVRLSPALIAQLLPERKYRARVVAHDLNGRYASGEYLLSSRGESVTDTLQMTPPVTHEGKITYWLFVDPLREIDERNDLNNWATISVDCVL